MLFVVLLATGYLSDFIYCYPLYSVHCWDLGRKGDTPAVEGRRLGISGQGRASRTPLVPGPVGRLVDTASLIRQVVRLCGEPAHAALLG